MKKNGIKLFKLTVILLLITGFMIEPIQGSELNSSQNSSLVEQNSSLRLTQVQIPKVKVVDIEFSNDLPEESETIEINFTVENKDLVDYMNFDLIVTLTEVLSHDGPVEQSQPEIMIIANETLSLISAGSTIQRLLEFQFKLGTYTLNAYLMINGTLIPDSEQSSALQVTGLPIGDNLSLIVALSIIIGFLILLTITPSIIDVVRRKNGNKPNSIK